MAHRVRSAARVVRFEAYAGRGLLGACPACFGASDSPMAAGMNAGIFVLLAVTALVLAAVGGVGFAIARRARSSASAEADVVPAGARISRGEA